MSSSLQPSLLDLPVRFDSGVELTQADHVRLGSQLERVLAIVRDEQWWSVPDVKRAIQQRFNVSDPETSISAQLRNARKPKHGGYEIERRRVRNLWEFKLSSGAK